MKTRNGGRRKRAGATALVFILLLRGATATAQSAPPEVPRSLSSEFHASGGVEFPLPEASLWDREPRFNRPDSGSQLQSLEDVAPDEPFLDDEASSSADPGAAWIRRPPPDGAPPLVRPAPTSGGMGGMGGMRGMGSPGGGGGGPFSFGAYGTPASDLSDRPGTLAAHGENLSVMVPILLGGEGFWGANVRLGHMQLATDARLPSLGRDFPDDLYAIQLGMMHMRTLDNGWKAGGIVGVGSSGERPFDAARDVQANFIGFLSVPSGERNAWNFALIYAPMGQLPFPIPGVSYLWRPTDRFDASLGVPLSANWRPRDDLTLSATWLPLTTVNCDVRWCPTPLWTLYGSLKTETDSYFLADRTDDSERFYAFDRKLALGVRRTLGKRWALDGSAAYVFDRSYYLAKSFSGDEVDETPVEPGVTCMLRLEWVMGPPDGRPGR